MNHKSNEQIHNRTNQAIMIGIEPWGDVLQLAPQSSFSIVAESQEEGELEVAESSEGGFIVYAWQGATCQVFQDDQIIQEYPHPVPPLPAGMSSRKFMELVFKKK